MSVLSLNSKDGGSHLLSWDRFFLYSKYVRYLGCVDINYAAFKRMMLLEPSTNFFSSNLTSLRWKGASEHIDCLLPLLTSTLLSLEITLGPISSWVVDFLCKKIATNTPLLRNFDITISSKNDHAAISSALGELMSRLSQLIFVAIPVQFMTPGLLDILSRLFNLQDLSMFKWRLMHHSLNGDRPEVEASLRQKLIVDEKIKDIPPFHSVKDLYIIDEHNFSLKQVHDLGTRFLNVLHLTCSPQGQPQEIISIMGLVHIVCPSLQTIIITKAGRNRGGKKKYSRFPWNAVEAVLKCPNLHTLRALRTIDMDPDDMMKLVMNRPFWQAVDLPSVNPVGFQALIPFAQHCPKLTLLGLTFGKDDKLPSLETFDTDGWFPSLTTLSAQQSESGTLTFPIQVGKFLASTCRNPLKIRARGKDVSSWKVVQGVVNSINLTNPDEYYKEIDLDREGDYYSGME